MKKKEKNVFSVIALVLLFLVLGGLVYNAINDVEKEEDPIEDVLPGEDVIETKTLTITNDAELPGHDDITILYEEGMTWEEFVNSNYNTNSFKIIQYREGGPYDSILKNIVVFEYNGGSVALFTNRGARPLETDVIEDLGFNFCIEME